MRILITVPWGQRLGGTESMLQSVLDASRGSEHELELVFLQDGPWPRELREHGFRVTVIPAGRMREAHRTVMALVRIVRVLRSRRPDVILNWSAKTQLYGALAAIVAGMPGRVVWWQHMIPSPRGWLDRCATLLPAQAVACCSASAARAQEALFPRRRTVIVAPGAPAPAPSETPPPLERPPGVTAVGLVGRLQPWKGQDRLLEAQAILRARGQEIHTMIVGGDAYGLSSDYARSLPALVERLGLSGAVTLTGQVDDPGPYIEQMDILVNASDPEPFGIVLLEAMARGVAVVAVDSGGPAEFIEDGVSGVLAASGEPAALADALLRLLGSAELRDAIGRSARDRYLHGYTEEAMFERLDRELRGLVVQRETAASTSRVAG